MTEEPIEAVIARLRHSTNLGWVDSADGHEGATVRVSDLSRLLDYVEGMRWRPLDDDAKNGSWILLRGRTSIGAYMVPIVARWGVSPTNPRAHYSWWDAASGKDLVSMIADSRGDADWMPLTPAPLHGKG